MEGNVVACFFQLFVCYDSHSRTHGVQILNTMDIGSVVQAITALYDCSVSVILFYEKQQTSPELINKAERFLSDIVNDNSIVIDLETGFAQGSEIVVFGLCNIVYQQVGK